MLFGIFSGVLDILANPRNNQLYNTLITTYAFSMIFFMVMSSLIDGFCNWFISILLLGASDNINNKSIDYSSFFYFISKEEKTKLSSETSGNSKF